MTTKEWMNYQDFYYAYIKESNIILVGFLLNIYCFVIVNSSF